MGDVVRLRPPLYEAKLFTAETAAGVYQISGTLCGHIDVAIPGGPTLILDPNEGLAVAQAIMKAREDVLDNSDPYGDPRLTEKE